jgi:hypothetical protein
LNAAVLNAMLADEDAWTEVCAPGARDSAHFDLPVGAVAANFAAERS